VCQVVKAELEEEEKRKELQEEIGRVKVLEQRLLLGVGRLNKGEHGGHGGHRRQLSEAIGIEQHKKSGNG